MHSELIKLEKTFSPSILTKIDDPLLLQYQIELWMKRDDLLHPVISGNKWRKLKYSLDHALSLGMDTIISMGGVYSNHLHALAYVGKVLGLKTIGLVRGEPLEVLTPALLDMKNWGMELKFVSRTDYRVLRQYKNWEALPGLKPRQYWLTEGGAQALALKGVAELVAETTIPYDTFCAPSGTGATLAGIVDAVPAHVSVLGFSALKNANFLTADIEAMLSQTRNNWQINLDYHFGGFAKINAELNAFIVDFELKTTIPLEPVYTGKMMYAIYDLIKKHYFKPGERIIAVHTGGLQGKRAKIPL
ncbi:pyridoxal-phosphate dependent enzyme [Methylobacter sp.]|uniref:1-aminocyclopropane-1-carboxylate deaminase/D-cysteine desulfhydrase n=1 Tax=Methylobacter sp. TaxID=2051955 RepID=UPI00120863DF|nr:pyridoxal-phosphate dependent enzyme [Methylobacter sp.]TAK61803.1 MAG: 1-aminocyclopropane-1-carboxylate deaminase/D-cysteine desulfhydrase [Methylobacter sp.]